MKQWLQTQIGRALDAAGECAVVLDPDRLVDAKDIAVLAAGAGVLFVRSWEELRLSWDLDLRRREDPSRTVILAASPAFSVPSDLPYDIERDADVVVRVRWPVPEALRGLFRVAGPYADALAAAGDMAASHDEVIALALDIRPGVVSDELGCVVKLQLAPTGAPPQLWQSLARALRTPLARRVAEQEGELTVLQQAWDQWLRDGDTYEHADELREASAGLVALLGAGMLAPAPADAADLPGWVSLGTIQTSPERRIAELLDAEPETPSTLDGWVATASWWGQVRAAIASNPTPPPIARHAWRRWGELDIKFGDWLRSSFGKTLLSSRASPSAVHQIAPFLARRVEDGAKVMLIILDGMGYAQWHRLRDVCGLKVIHADGCMAMLPTITVLSRQAILAGALPRDFSDTSHTTGAEKRRWTEFWTHQGLAPSEVHFEHYHKQRSYDSAQVPALHARVIAVVVNAIDDILHGADVLGDRQVDRGVELWGQTGHFPRIVETANHAGYETWVTSDHGNLPTVGGVIPRESKALASNGERARIYSNSTLRDVAREHGVAWDPPGFPKTTGNPLFARGRSGYHSGDSRVTHGGLSMDEVIVPFVRVTT